MKKREEGFITMDQKLTLFRVGGLRRVLTF
jgi:hypothetical protein